MGERFKPTVLKTVVREYRGFESLSLRQGRFLLKIPVYCGEMAEWPKAAVC